jgi:hypothetical protein
MLFTKMVFIGVSPASRKGYLNYAALNYYQEILALKRAGVEETLAFIGGQNEAYVAVAFPQRPNLGLMADENIRSSLNPVPRPGRWQGWRVAEYFLRMRGIMIRRTPGADEKCPVWMRKGFQFFASLERMGFQAYPQDDNPRQLLEVYAHAAYSVLLNRNPFKKATLEGRLQRQLALYAQRVDVADPMRVFEEFTRHRLLQGILPVDNLHTPRELDALVAAYTAWVAARRPKQITQVGDPREGQITLPIDEMLPAYH